MRDILNAGVRLLAIACVAALLLAGTNMITRGPIAVHSRDDAAKARHAVLPDAEDFVSVEWPESIELTAFPALAEAYEGVKGGEVIGYVFLLRPMGYMARIPVSVGISLPGEPSAAGRITGIAIGDISETSGIGSRVKDAPFTGRFSGISTDRVSGVDTISGATVSSSAVKNAVSTAVLAFDALRSDGQAED